jgi:hypothetical protein
MQSCKIKKGDNSNLIDCNAIAQNIKGRKLQFNRLQCNCTTLGRLEPNLAGMFLGWSSTKLLFFVPVGYSIWLPRPIICSDWPKFQRSSSRKIKKGDNSNLIDCNAIAQNIKGRKLQFNRLQGNRAKQKREATPN